MNADTTLVPSEGLATAQRFLQALHDGRIIDALDTFSADAILQEGDGREHHGLKDIAQTLLPYRTPGRVDIVGIRGSDHEATAQLRARQGLGQATREYRATFRVSGRRIQSIVLRPS